jgi:hypothetical protein
MKHETKNTTAILKWCSTCGRNTMHRVSNCRVGTCMEAHSEGLSKKQELRHKQEEKEEAKKANLKFEF